jgi:hypothetical protein
VADGGVLWQAATHAGHSALEAIELLYTAAGATDIYRASALDRCLRDARTAVQHICLRHQNYELAGRHLLDRPLIPSPWAMEARIPATTRHATPSAAPSAPPNFGLASVRNLQAREPEPVPPELSKTFVERHDRGA